MPDKKDAPLLDDYVFKRTFTRDDPNGIIRENCNKHLEF